jgi:hypothetical protein
MESALSSETFSRLERRPARVVCAVALLWAAWLVAATDLFVNHVMFQGSQVGPGVSIGAVSLVVFAAALVLVWRGSRGGRYVTVLFLILSTAPLQMLSRLIVERSPWTASYVAASFALKAVGVLLLFTGDSRRWFARTPAAVVVDER